MTLDHYTNVLKFWRAVETFNLPDLPSPVWGKDAKVYSELKAGAALPWELENFSGPQGDKEWRHTLYFYAVTKEAVVDRLAKLSGSKAYREPVSGRSFLSSLVLDPFGQPMDRSYMPAAFIYGIKILQERLDTEELPELLRKAQEEFLVRWQMEKGQQKEEDKPIQPGMVNWAMLQRELDFLKEVTHHGLKAELPVFCISEYVTSGSNAEAAFLNSYYVHDLNKLIGNIGDIGKPLEMYLTRDVNINHRYDLLSQPALLKSLHPGNQCAGRWPSLPDLGLYSAQQAALHLAMPDLRQQSTLIGINGPPGTGKTTLLREVIADVVVGRARRLLKENVLELFTAKRTVIVDMLGYYKINETVFGNDGIVVSSNNNTAIENISKELPVYDSIDRETFDHAGYFSSFASHIHDAPCWGMLSAVLGKAGNRSTFISKFWFSKEHGFGRFLKKQYDDHVQSKKNAEQYEATSSALRKLLDEYDLFTGLAGEYHDLLLQLTLEKKGSRQRLEELALRLITEYDIPGENIPDIGFSGLTLERIHRLTPYSSRKINTLRSNIFLLSLELHEWAIRVNARQFSSNLNAFVNMVSNKHSGFIDGEVAAMLWNTFFFCIPVTSVTLASFQRQFPKLGKGSIGWLLLDEAGQAMPASACGAIWRAQRCIIIGDTLQIPPVVTIPATLGKLLQDSYGIKDDCWSPVFYSAQFLADRVTRTGTYIDLEDGERTWTGMPLRAHRRCSEPMFSLSNVIAYNGQMVKVTRDVVTEVPTGRSGWIDVKGFTLLEGHALAEEIQALGDLLQQLRHYIGKIYVISPFASVAKICREEFNRKDKIECGTIHTFQGKEASVVFLILGTLPKSEFARNWVAQSPNMLNVAVTRAKDRLYVIGNRQVWVKHRYFDYLAEKLPIKESGLLSL